MNDPERRCKNGDLSLIAQGPFQSWWEVRTTYPLEQCINNQFFVNERSNFRAGDCINMVRYDNDTWKQVLEVCNMIRVGFCDANGVELIQDFAIKKHDKPGEQGIVVGRGFAGKFVVRVDGATYVARNTLVEANEAAVELGREKGLPVTLYDAKTKKPAETAKEIA